MEQEKIYVEKEHKDYASKATGNAGLTLGIIGTSLAGLLWAKNHGAWGSSNSATMGYNVDDITAKESYMKECEDNIALTRAIYDMRITDLQEKYALRNNDTHEKFGLYQSQVNGDSALQKEISDLRCQVAVGNAIRPYQDKLIQCEIDRAFTASVNYTNEKTCRMITGTLVSPTSPVISGVPTYCCCQSTNA